ncbi:hypothetical protein [Frankia nepalensis]|uniref:Uncharacterized protein n=1 Tax=Frankia nepalensis TaxID=1836974 RepID=A0A937RDX4_9ACTN|nr:hypothetical protein [Frankia nepalensis]MBL7494733.1 hypothetical protein [Frankia nepalensis]MBL7513999.1 hypothetical protein [Frankia nepalensis]MBL7628167.1 hypothetical protein [Frankia nepalensis]
MWSWQINEAAGRERGEQLRREAEAARTARRARPADEEPRPRRLALDPDEVYPEEPGDRRGARRRSSNRRG